MFSGIRAESQRRTNGFTLIELLVVIAIIAILASILFPVFARARENARRSSCLSNERQLGMAFMQYFQDYDERFPLLGKKLGTDATAPVETSWVYTMQAYIKSGQMLRCISDTTPAAEWVPDADWNSPSVSLRRTSYVLNGFLPQGNSTDLEGGNFPHLASIKKPSSVIFLTEAPPTGKRNYFHAHKYPTGHWIADIDRPDDIAHDRHLGGFNATYLDGHAKWVRWDRIWFTDPAYTPALKGQFDPRQE